MTATQHQRDELQELYQARIERFGAILSQDQQAEIFPAVSDLSQGEINQDFQLTLTEATQ